MLPYGMKKRKAKIHPHDECEVCRAHPPEKGTARAEQKRITKDMLNESKKRTS